MAACYCHPRQSIFAIQAQRGKRPPLDQASQSCLEPPVSFFGLFAGWRLFSKSSTMRYNNNWTARWGELAIYLCTVTAAYLAIYLITELTLAP